MSSPTTPRAADPSGSTSANPVPTAASATGPAGPADPPPSGGRSWYRNRFVWVAVILLVVSATTVALVRGGGSEGTPEEVREQLDVRLLTLFEEIKPEQHHGHGELVNQVNEESSKVVCGVRTFGFEPKDATRLADVDRAFAFHLCGVAEPNKPWDWAVKLVGPVIVGMTTEPPTVEVAQATDEINFPDRVRQMFPPEYQEIAIKEFISKEQMAELRRRYDDAAGL